MFPTTVLYSDLVFAIRSQIKWHSDYMRGRTRRLPGRDDVRNPGIYVSIVFIAYCLYVRGGTFFAPPSRIERDDPPSRLARGTILFCFVKCVKLKARNMLFWKWDFRINRILLIVLRRLIADQAKDNSDWNWTCEFLSAIFNTFARGITKINISGIPAKNSIVPPLVCLDKQPTLMNCKF